MSPLPPNPAPLNPHPSHVPRPTTKPQRNSKNTREPTQNTIWGFVQSKLPTAPPDPPPDFPDATQATTASQESGRPLALTPPAIRDPPSQLSTAYQLPLNSEPTNYAWGDANRYAQLHDCFRIVSKNVSTLNPQALDMTAMAVELQHSNTSVFLAQETNTAWKPAALLAIQSQCHRVHKHSKLATSSSQDSTEARFQPGGTLTLALGKWASRVIGSGQDDILGRWSFLEFVGQHGRRVIVASAYRVCPQQFDATTITATAQQTRLLLQNGIPHPNPRKQFITDIIRQIRQWRQQGKEVLVGMDANENVDDPRSHIAQLFDETDLVDLHHHRFPATNKPATHQRGSAPIDLLLGSPLLADALQYAWILPFGEPALIKGDHRLLGADFSPHILFGNNTATPSSLLLRGVNSKNDQQVQLFCQRAVRQCNQYQLDSRIKELLTKEHLDAEAIHELEAVDHALTKILLSADRYCRPLSQAPWSPELRTAYMAHRYWALKRSAHRTKRDLSSALTAIAARLDPSLTAQDPNRSLSAHLKQAQKRLKQARRNAAALRRAHLETVLNQTIAANHQKKTRALTYLIRAERNRQCYARFRQHTKPKAPGGLAFVNIIDAEGIQKPLLERTELEETLLEHSRVHFAKAEGSRFTTEPLNRLLEYDGLTSFGDRLTNGKPFDTLYSFDEPTTAILQNLKRKVPAPPENSPKPDYSQLLEGIKKWPERTTTSPSGRHLGIYKTLAKHVLKKEQDAPPLSVPEPGIIQGRDVLYLIFDIMFLALTHTYPLERWRNVWTIFIEKEIGNPDLNRLRCIMLFEADWQLLLKWHSSYGFLPRTEEEGTLSDAQGGGRKGRSAIDQATQQVVETEIVHFQQKPHIDLYLDLRTCFDLMVEACHNLACRRHGAVDAYLRLHAKTHQLMRYFVRHKFGVSTEYNTFAQQPWHGAGQGAADAALRYIALSDTLIDAYHTKVAPQMMQDPTTLIEVQRSLKAFIDDVVLHATSENPDDLNDLQARMQAQLKWWAQLVQVTGGELNPTKCCGMVYTWEPDTRGILKLAQPLLPADFLSITTTDRHQPIPIIAHHDGTRYLGLYLTADRSTRPMEQHLMKKAILYTTAFRRTPMTHREAGVLYRSCFIPALAYPLPATWLPDTFFAKVHQISTSTILNKMGYHRTLPRSMVFAPKHFGGVGLRHLQQEMEAQQIIMLLRHLRAHSPLGQTMEILIRQYQLWSGFSQSVLMDTTPCPWVPDKWLSRIRRTMHEHNIKIQHEAWVILPLRQHDVFLMEAISDCNLSNSQLEQVNACRMFLQVTTLAEIVDHTGRNLLPQALKPTNRDGPEGLSSLSATTLQWPCVHPPSKASWSLWTRTICNLFAGAPQGRTLQHPLGPWTPDYQTVRVWKWRLSPLGSLLYKEHPTATTRAALQSKALRTQLTFTLTVPTNQQFTGPPVTPYDEHNRVVPLPIPALPHRAGTQTNAYHRTLMEQFRTTLENWQLPLFGPLQRHQPNPAILEVSLADETISVVSDASVQKSKQSGFAWTIAHGSRILWKGVGLAPGTAEDLYSGRAEAFGLIASLIFLRHYILSYGQDRFHPSKLDCFCDNLGVITNVTKLLTPAIVRPNDTTNDDRDVYLAISTLATQCYPFQPSFLHVKGHQDARPNRPLTITEQHNVDCDRRAKIYTQTTTKRSTTYGNPAIPAAQPHLIIDRKIICRNLPTTLYHTLAFPKYRHYLKQKLGCTDRTLNDVHWTVFATTLRAFGLEDQRRIILFTNGKLPLRASPAHPHYGSKTCPSCQRQLEDRGHFLRCTNRERSNLFHTLHQNLIKLTQHVQLHPSILTALWLGLVTTRNDSPYPDIQQEMIPAMRQPLQLQTQLGWEQLYHGRITSAWATTIDKEHPRLKQSGEQIMIMIQKLIWQFILDTWKLRNQHHHHNATQLDLPNYRQAAISLYEQRAQLPPAAQEALYRQPLATVLDLPAPQLELWVVRGHKYFNKQVRAAKYQAKLNTHDIRTFFTLHTSNDLQPP